MNCANQKMCNRYIKIYCIDNYAMRVMLRVHCFIMVVSGVGVNKN